MSQAKDPCKVHPVGMERALLSVSVLAAIWVPGGSCFVLRGCRHVFSAGGLRRRDLRVGAREEVMVLRPLELLMLQWSSRGLSLAMLL